MNNNNKIRVSGLVSIVLHRTYFRIARFWRCTYFTDIKIYGLLHTVWTLVQWENLNQSEVEMIPQGRDFSVNSQLTVTCVNFCSTLHMSVVRTLANVCAHALVRTP